MKKTTKYLRYSEIRNMFWENHPEFIILRSRRKTQNDYPADVRMAWVNFIDSLHRNGQIGDQVAADITL